MRQTGVQRGQDRIEIFHDPIVDIDPAQRFGPHVERGVAGQPQHRNVGTHARLDHRRRDVGARRRVRDDVQFFVRVVLVSIEDFLTPLRQQ